MARDYFEIGLLNPGSYGMRDIAHNFCDNLHGIEDSALITRK